MLTPAAKAAISQAAGTRARFDEPLARHCSLGVGGPADCLIEADTIDHLRDVARLAASLGLSLLVLGGGTNVVVSDLGVRGLVALNRARQWRLLEGETLGRSCVRVESGAFLSSLALRLAEVGLGGLEFACGIPGTVGGAVVGNAGAFGRSMADCVSSVVSFRVASEACEDSHRGPKDLSWGYRASIFKGLGQQEIVLGADIVVGQGDKSELMARIGAQNARRRGTQPMEPSVGSVFRNPAGDFAARLIEEAGLKGLRVGAAEVSTKHANFIVNKGGCTARDYRTVVDRVTEAVRRHFGIDLVPEVRFVGEW